jgi:PTS system beta-glucosides-specific IIC component
MPVVLMSYSTTVIPILVSIVIYSFLERFLKRFIPSQLHLLFLPLLSLMIMVPLTVMIFGPFGVYVGKGIAAATAWIIAKSPILAGLLIGGFWIPIVVFGLHWAIIPIILSNIATNGSDPILAIAMGSVWAASGAGLGVLFKTKNAQLKEIAASGLIPGLLSGVTEPIIYGIFFRYKRSFAYVIAMSAISGVIAGVLQVKATQLAGGIFTIPTFNLIWGYALSAAVVFFGTAALHWIFGFGEEPELASGKAEQKGSSEEDFKTTNVDTVITSPVAGVVVPVKDINDSVFSSEAMGATVAVDPSSNVVKVPFSGKVVKVFPTLHAIGLLSDGGVEVLIHIGLDAVNLNGEGFTSHVKDNQKVTAGQDLISFDVEQIKAKGYDPVVLIIVTNQNEQQHLKKYAVSNEQVTAGNKLLEINNK